MGVLPRVRTDSAAARPLAPLRLAALHKVPSVAVDLDAWQQHRSALSSSRLMGQLPRQGNPPQSEWGSPEKSPKAANAGGLL